MTALADLARHAEPAGIAVLAATPLELPAAPNAVTEASWQLHFFVFSLAVVDALVMLGLDLPEGVTRIDDIREYLRAAWGYDDAEVATLRRAASSLIGALPGTPPRLTRAEALAIRDQADDMLGAIREAVNVCCALDAVYAMETPRASPVAARLDRYRGRNGSEVEMRFVLDVAEKLLRGRPSPLGAPPTLEAAHLAQAEKDIAAGRFRTLEEVRRDLAHRPPASR